MAKFKREKKGTEVPDSNPSQQTLVIRERITRRGLIFWLVLCGLIISLGFNFVFYRSFSEYFVRAQKPIERFHSGAESGDEKIALIEVKTTIMPPFTGRILKSIKAAREDEDVKGVILVIDSPGGLVADSHQIYHKLQQLREEKPVYVAMKRIAASGGYYISMGAGPDAKVFVEPTTWTGSIGVIIPRYEFVGLKDKIGVDSVPLKTGELKDALSPFRPLGEKEKEVWGAILDESYQRFVNVIKENRPKLKAQRIEEENLFDGRIFTAQQAIDIGMVDELGFLEDAVKTMSTDFDLDEPRVITYKHPMTLLDIAIGNMEAKSPENQWRQAAEATIPRAMYFFSWGLGLPGSSLHE